MMLRRKGPVCLRPWLGSGRVNKLWLIASLSNDGNDIADGRPSRTLGLVVLRGPQITLISPTDGYEGESLERLLGSFLRNRRGIEMLMDSLFCIYFSIVEISNPFAQAE
jgi:hypothetical protein